MPTLNITSDSTDWRARRLSNFSADTFILDGTTFASVEGFVQGIKFPFQDPVRLEAFNSVGKEAKNFGSHAERKFVWWNGKTIVFGSEKHHGLIELAIRAKFDQNPEALKALIDTDQMDLIHEFSEPEAANTSLPAKVFCDILTRIRSEHQDQTA